MNFTDIIALLGGVALFLYGMGVMGDSLKKVAGGSLEVTLYKLTGNTFRAVLLGAGVTAVIQSSGATSVMATGFVNSRLMKTRQAIGIILGSILGTSITGWILCLSDVGTGGGIGKYFSTAVITAVIALIGIVLQKISKKRTLKNVGAILLGLAVLLYGMSAMSGAVSGLKESQGFISLITKFSNPIFGVLIGIAITAVLQSASAAVGILQALAATGAISFGLTLPCLMGIAVGSSLPVLLSSIGADTDGKRTSWSYLIINIFGCIITAILYYPLNAVIHFGYEDVIMTSFTIALLNTLFRALYVIILCPFTSLIEKFMCLIIRAKADEEAEEDETGRLEERFLEHPALALENSRVVTISMAEKSRKNILKALSLCEEFDKVKYQKVYAREDIIDRYEDKLGTYLMKITAKALSKKEREEITKFLHCITDFERIADHSVNIADVGNELNEKKASFSGDARHELDVLTEATCEILNTAIDSFVNDDIDCAAKVEPLEEVIDDLCDKLKDNHVERLQRGECTLTQGFMFNDLLNNIERVADHCSNIAVAVIETRKDEFETHSYLNGDSYKQSTEFIGMYYCFKHKYEI